MNDELWYFLINGQADNNVGLCGNFYAYGKHLGDALKNTYNASLEKKFNNPNLLQASRLDNFEVIGNSDELLKLSDFVHMRQKTFSFPFDDPDKEFIPPVGIVNGVDEGEYDYDLIRECFVAYGQDESGVFEFELVLDKSNLIDTFIKTIDFLPTVDGFWIYIKNYWESDKTELWVSKHFEDRDSIIDFLSTQRTNTTENGYIDIVIHSSTGETNLKLGEHKKIHLHTKDENVFNSFIGQVVDLGYEQTRELYNLEFGFQHWHYRPADSLTRKEFIAMLTDHKFELIDKWDE